MRITTKLFSFITVLVALAMLLMLVGSTYSFYRQSHEKAERQLRTLALTLDQSLLIESYQEIQKWLPAMMHLSGVVGITVINSSGHTVYQLKLPISYDTWDSFNHLRFLQLPMIQHPGYSLNVVYFEPTKSYMYSLKTMLPITISISAMVAILLLAYRWLHERMQAMEKLERRASKILNGKWESTNRSTTDEFPPNASNAIDRLLADLANAREERERVDTLIRAFVAQDSRTGLNNRLFFENQLTTLLEDEGAHGAVLMLHLPDWGEVIGQRDEFCYSLVNMLSTLVMRYPSGLLARYYQDNFAVLLPHRSLKEAESFAAQVIGILKVIPSIPSIVAEQVLYIGLSLYHYGQNTEQVVVQVEQAVRNAVLQGSNGWFVDGYPVLEVNRGSVKWRTLLEQTLHQGGPTLFQQPVILSFDGSIDHYSLIAYIYDKGQAVLSAEFYPLVQQLGLAEHYDRQILNNIIPLLRTRSHEKFAFPISVTSLLQRSFQSWLRDTLLQNERRVCQRILLELNEADVSQHIEQLRSILRLIRAVGAKIAVSQAGLKVVSTAYIKELQVTLVKLHPGLVRNIDKRIENQLFIQSLTGACEGTATKVFAAGVRTKEEWDTLKNKGIYGGQGDFLAKPQRLFLRGDKSN